MRLVEEFGWTLSELDEQDEARALRLLAARNIEAALRQVQDAVNSHKLNSLSPATLRLWQMVHKSEADNVN